MKYKKSDLKKVFNDLVGLEKPEDIRVRVAEILTDLEADYSEHEDVVNQNTQLQEDVKDLEKANYKLFRMVGSPNPEPAKEDENKDDQSNLTYDELFNEDGGLK